MANMDGFKSQRYNSAEISLNTYRDDIKRFMAALKEDKWTPTTIVQALEEELAVLKANINDKAVVDHQLYDLLFLLLELAAHNHTNLDAEWHRGQEKKKKYTIK